MFPAVTADTPEVHATPAPEANLEDAAPAPMAESGTGPDIADLAEGLRDQVRKSRIHRAKRY